MKPRYLLIIAAASGLAVAGCAGSVRTDSDGRSTDNTSSTSRSSTTQNTDVDVDRKSTRLNSSHRCISYAVFCLKKKKRSTQTSTLCSFRSSNETTQLVFRTSSKTPHEIRISDSAPSHTATIPA